MTLIAVEQTQWTCQRCKDSVYEPPLWWAAGGGCVCGTCFEQLTDREKAQVAFAGYLLWNIEYPIELEEAIALDARNARQVEAPKERI